VTDGVRDLFWISRDDTRYTYAVAVVRALERTLLGSKTLEAMARAASSQEALEELGETSYGKFMLPGQRVEDLEPLLERVLVDAYALFQKLILDEELEQALLLPHDIHNVKALLKAHLAGSEPVGIVPFGMLDVEALRPALESGLYRDLPPMIEPAVRQALDDFEMHTDPRRLEILLDQVALRCKITPLLALDSPVISAYARQLADVMNIRFAVRLSRSDPNTEILHLAFVKGGTIGMDTLETLLGKPLQALVDALSGTPYGKAVHEGIEYLQRQGSYALLDRELENQLVQTLRAARFLIFGPGPLLAHTMAKEHEVSMVRLVMVGKLNTIPSERIVARLPTLYV
jgi:V/A-type H+-transporting ATPase subunit C